ncbi:HAD family hydrolase [Flavobacterium succinicans]|uniref:phosphoserine phosphatase n=1 Tax=Flavobacterium succinicans TaxID=29536 RepID=A0A199XUQ1_9FLAO|nr:HAD family hydrolase [Flavobacterium succinicans]OAZ05498.1 haloacid dehalogenase-like hydrolase [Flavobacterium succinicans]
MKEIKKITLLFIVTLTSLSYSFAQQQINKSRKKTTIAVANPLPSWNEGATKKSIIDFVTKTTKEGSKDFIPVSDRIACFDNDGTLWNEFPICFEFAFAIDRVKAMAAQHPEWKTTQPFQAVLEGDMKTALSGGEESLMQIIAATHTGTSTEVFEQNVKDWLQTAIHPKTGKHYTEMVFQPMLELLNYLRANGYKTFIVSGGGDDFMRVFSEQVYGIPPYQVVGSSVKVKYDTTNGKPTLIKLPEVNFINNKDGKPVGIYQHIGKKPVFTAGNSDGDYAMLQWTSTASTPQFGLIIHHTDAEREAAYDRTSSIGHLEKALDDAVKYNWQIVDIKNDWKKIYPFEK